MTFLVYVYVVCYVSRVLFSVQESYLEACDAEKQALEQETGLLDSQCKRQAA